MKSILKIVIFAVLFSGFTLYAQEENEGEREVQETVEEIEEVTEEAANAEAATAAAAEVAEEATAAAEEATAVTAGLAEIRSALRLLAESQGLLTALLTTTDEIPGVDEVAAAVQAVDTELEEVETAVQEAVTPVETSSSMLAKFLGVTKTTLEVLVGFNLVFEAGKIIAEGYKRWKEDGESGGEGENVAFNNHHASVNYKCLSKQLKSFSSGYKPLVSACNNTLMQVKDPINDFKEVYPEFKTYGEKLENDLKPLSYYAKASSATLKRIVNDLNNVLDSSLDYKFTISFAGLSHDFHIHLISVKDALKGIDHIINQLNSKMNPTLAKAAKVYGLNKIAKEIEKLAKDAFSKAEKDFLNELKKINQPEIKNLVNTLSKIDNDYKKTIGAVNKIIHVGIPQYDKNVYQQIREDSFGYFLKACGQ